MALFENIIKFINEKILRKQPQKLLSSGDESDELDDNAINISPIKDYMRQDKYGIKLYVSFKKIKPVTKRALLSKIETRIERNSK